MRGSAAFRAAVAPGGALAGPWVKNELWRRARAVPSLDLRFAENKSLVDATTGSNLVTFTRASSGTFVGSDGLLRSAVTNLVLRSEEFNTGWSTAGITVAANTSTAPNGTVTADTITENSATDPHLLFQTTTASGTCTFSIYVKQGSGSRFFTIGFNRAATHFVSATFDLALGTNTQTLVLGYSGQSASITAVGDGYYRCSVTAVSDTVSDARIGLASTSTHTSTSRGFQSYTGDGTSSFIVWGAQLEQSSTVGEYIPTTSTINSAPRFDHNPTTGESLGLLVEEQRTNLVLRSEEFDDAYWQKVDASISANATASPAGATTADRLIDANTNALHYAIRAVTVVANTACAYSIYVKAGEYSRCRIRFGKQGSPFTRIGIVVNLNDGTITNSDVGTPTSVAVRSAVNVGGGWYRISVAGVFDTTSTDGYIEATIVDNSGNAVFTGTGTDGLFIWGAQLEAGAFATSYIPTTSATVTRSADVASISGSNFSSWYRQDEGCVFAEWTATGSNSFASVYQFHNNAATTNLLEVYRNNSDTAIAARIREASGTQQTLAFASQNWLRVGNKIATSYAVNDYAGSINGGTILSDSSLNLPAPSVLAFGAAQEGSANKYLSGTIRRLTYWPTRLPDSTLQAVTQ